MPRERIKEGTVWKITTSVDPADQQGKRIEPALAEHYDGATLQKGESLRQDPSLDLTWDRDHGYVQVSIDIPRESWIELADDLKKPDNEDVISRAMYTDGLTRFEINKLIRTLRRARDAAFGADE